MLNIVPGLYFCLSAYGFSYAPVVNPFVGPWALAITVAIPFVISRHLTQECASSQSEKNLGEDLDGQPVVSKGSEGGAMHFLTHANVSLG